MKKLITFIGFIVICLSLNSCAVFATTDDYYYHSYNVYHRPYYYPSHPHYSHPHPSHRPLIQPPHHRPGPSPSIHHQPKPGPKPSINHHPKPGPKPSVPPQHRPAPKPSSPNRR